MTFGIHNYSIESTASWQGVAAAPHGSVSGIQGWHDVCLLAPQAELRLLLCGVTHLIDPKRMGYTLPACLHSLLQVYMCIFDCHGTFQSYLRLCMTSHREGLAARPSDPYSY